MNTMIRFGHCLLNRFRNFLLLFLLSLLFHFPSFSQCENSSGATFIVTGYDTSNYSIETGQVLYVEPDGIVSGKITMAGGTVCIKGLFNPTVFNAASGTIYNDNSIILPGSISFPAALSLTNTLNGKLDVSGGMTLSGGSFINNGKTNISGFLVRTSGSLNNSSIINAKELHNNGGSYNNTGTVNSN